MSTASKDKLLKELMYKIKYRSLHTRNQYFAHVNRYLDYVGDGDWKDRVTLDLYAEKLKKKFSQDYVNYLVRGPIGALFRAHGLIIPIVLPPVMLNADMSERVAFETSEVAAMIATAKKSGNLQLQALLAISTVYGPRASEVMAMRREHIHPKKNTIVIYTLKGGLKREHLIPPEIEKYLFNYEFPVISLDRLYKLLNNLAVAAGVTRGKRKSYHAIRHALVNGLSYDGYLSDEKMFQFGGWRKGGIVGQYAKPFPFKPKLDQEIFEKHPFLKFWE